MKGPQTPTITQKRLQPQQLLKPTFPKLFLTRQSFPQPFFVSAVREWCVCVCVCVFVCVCVCVTDD